MLQISPLSSSLLARFRIDNFLTEARRGPGDPWDCSREYTRLYEESRESRKKESRAHASVCNRSFIAISDRRKSPPRRRRNRMLCVRVLRAVYRTKPLLNQAADGTARFGSEIQFREDGKREGTYTCALHTIPVASYYVARARVWRKFPLRARSRCLFGMQKTHAAANFKAGGRSFERARVYH